MSALYVLLGLLIAGVPLLALLRGGRGAVQSATRLRDPLAWLIAKDPQKARRLGVVGALVGVGALALLTSWLLVVPWELDATSPHAMSSGGTCDAAGARYVLRVGEGSYWCGGGDGKCPRGDVEISYASSNPNHCRVRSNVDRPSLYELETGLFALAWFAFAAATVTFSEAGAPSRPYIAATWLFFALVGAMFVSSVFYSG